MKPAGQDTSKHDNQATTLATPPQHYSSSLAMDGDLASSMQSDLDDIVGDDLILGRMEEVNTLVCDDSYDPGGQLPTEGSATLASQGHAVVNDLHDPTSDLGIPDLDECVLSKFLEDILEDAKAGAEKPLVEQQSEWQLKDLVEASEVNDFFAAFDSSVAAFCPLDDICDSTASVNNQPYHFENNFGFNPDSSWSQSADSYSADLDRVSPNNPQGLISSGLNSAATCVSWSAAFAQDHNVLPSLLPASYEVTQPRSNLLMPRKRGRPPKASKESKIAITQEKQALSATMGNVAQNKPFAARRKRRRAGKAAEEDVSLIQVAGNKNPYVAVTWDPESELPLGEYSTRIINFSQEKLRKVIEDAEKTREDAEASHCDASMRKHKVDRAKAVSVAASQKRRLRLLKALLHLHQQREVQKGLKESLMPELYHWGAHKQTKPSLGSRYKLEKGPLGDKRTKRQVHRDHGIVALQYTTFKIDEAVPKNKDLSLTANKLELAYKNLSQKLCSAEEEKKLTTLFQNFFRASASGDEKQLSEAYERLQKMIEGLPALDDDQSYQSLGDDAVQRRYQIYRARLLSNNVCLEEAQRVTSAPSTLDKRAYGPTFFLSSSNQQATLPALPSVSSPLTFCPTQKFSKL